LVSIVLTNPVFFEISPRLRKKVGDFWVVPCYNFLTVDTGVSAFLISNSNTVGESTYLAEIVLCFVPSRFLFCLMWQDGLHQGVWI
jgi:hypothetical protein